MPAAITTILDAARAELEALYPAIPVRTSKRRAVGGEQLKDGKPLGYPAPCIVLSCGDPERVDGLPSFEHVSLGYDVAVEYIKSPNAAVPGAADKGMPAPVVEDPDVRDKRDAIRAALYRTLAAAGAFDTRHDAGDPYGPVATKPGIEIVSAQAFRFTLLVPRPGA